MRTLIGLAVILFGSVAMASQPRLIGQVDHDKMKNFASVASIVDGNRVCLIASATRSPQGASTSMDCYIADRAPRFQVVPNGEFMHDGRINNTSFKVIDSNNNTNCYGSLITRASTSNSTSLSGAAIKIKCL